MDWALSGLMIVVNILLGRKNKWGWIILMGTNILWIIYALTLTPPQVGLLPAILVNQIIAGASTYKWFKDDHRNAANTP